MRSKCRLLQCALSAFVALACEDFSTVDYQRPVSDAAVHDANPGDSATSTACLECVTDDAGACGAANAACSANAACKAVFDCILPIDCLKGIDPNAATSMNLPQCVIDCLNSAHVSINDVIAPALAMFTCSSRDPTCRAACYAN